MRFDEIELAPVIFEDEETATPTPPATTSAPLFKRLLALLTDLSLFVALTLALSPLLPVRRDWIPIASLAGFVVLVSFYYFTGCWLVWRKTIGGAIFDVRVISDEGDAIRFSDAAKRWAILCLPVVTAAVVLFWGHI
jgi:uncharacterized RDD family membrane protein YckC